MSKLYRPPPQRQDRFYLTGPAPSNKNTGPAKSSNSQWVGASILLYSVVNGNVYFILGQEVTVAGYKDSGKWSDFGGGANWYEDEYTCAAREYLEETQRTINPFPKKYGHCLPDAQTIIKELKEGNFAARIDFNFLNTRYPKTYTTFLVEIPFDPTLKIRFAKRVRQSRPKGFTNNRYSNFQGKLNSKRRGQVEKVAIDFFSIPTLLGHTKQVQTSSSRKDFVQPLFRKFFTRRVKRILEFAFPQNLHQFRVMYKIGTYPLRRKLTPTVYTSTVKQTKGQWARGVQVQPQVSLGGSSSQPPARLFHNFNTHKKYPITNMREARDKIYM